MKYIYTLFVALGLTAATKLYANDNLVSVMINKQTYQFDRPIRLSSVLSIVADNGDWYWPSASAFDLANPKAEEEKEIALSQISGLLNQFDADSETHSRGIAAFKNHIYLSSNTGLIYDHDIKRHTTTAMNLNNPLKELRDIDVNGKKIVAMQSDNSSKLVYVINNKSIAIPINREEIFFDGMVLYAQKGMMFGDPKNGNIPVFISKSGGIQWSKAPTPLKALDGEYGFSASGNNIKELQLETLKNFYLGKGYYFQKYLENRKRQSDQVHSPMKSLLHYQT